MDLGKGEEWKLKDHVTANESHKKGHERSLNSTYYSLPLMIQKMPLDRRPDPVHMIPL